MIFGSLGNIVWRTVTALFPALARPDDTFAKTLLSEAEYNLYKKMDVRDRAHACAVTQQLLARYPDASPELRRAALLHDVGKASARYNPWLRILAALYTPRHVAPEPPPVRGAGGVATQAAPRPLRRGADRSGRGRRARRGDRGSSSHRWRHSRPRGGAPPGDRCPLLSWTRS